MRPQFEIAPSGPFFTLPLGTERFLRRGTRRVGLARKQAARSFSRRFHRSNHDRYRTLWGPFVIRPFRGRASLLHEYRSYLGCFSAREDRHRTSATGDRRSRFYSATLPSPFRLLYERPSRQIPLLPVGASSRWALDNLSSSFCMFVVNLASSSCLMGRRRQHASGHASRLGRLWSN